MLQKSGILIIICTLLCSCSTVIVEMSGELQTGIDLGQFQNSSARSNFQFEAQFERDDHQTSPDGYDATVRFTVGNTSYISDFIETAQNISPEYSGSGTAIIANATNPFSPASGVTPNQIRFSYSINPGSAQSTPASRALLTSPSTTENGREFVFNSFTTNGASLSFTLQVTGVQQNGSAANFNAATLFQFPVNGNIFEEQ